MTEHKKPTIQIKTSSPACSGIVADWAAAQKNVNESVKTLIKFVASHTGYVDIENNLDEFNKLKALFSDDGAVSLNQTKEVNTKEEGSTREVSSVSVSQVSADSIQKDEPKKEETQTKIPVNRPLQAPNFMK